VHDRGEFDGQLWITMDYVDGPDLGALVSAQYSTGMPVDAVAAVVGAVSDALDHAHHRGLLHRDVKPANIMVSQPDADSPQRILLSDFGIARPIDDASGLTATNMAVGTVNYSAPEQLMGAAIDGRADQYALAATAYYLLTGTKMFANLPAVAVISAHLTAPPPLPGAVRPELAATDAVFARALAKDPGQRFERCSDFAAALAEQLRNAQHHRRQHAQAPGGPPDSGPTRPWTAAQPGPAPPPSKPPALRFDPAPWPGAETHSPAAPATPGSAPWPPVPSALQHAGAPKPASRRRRRLRVVAVSAAVLAVAGVVAYFAFPHGAPTDAPPSATSAQESARLAAQRYLEALARGDADAALSFSANAPATTAWVSADALRAQLALTPITDIAVTSAPAGPSDDPTTVQYVVMSARFGKTASQTRIAVRRNGNDWKLDTVTAPVDIGTPGASGAFLKAVALLGIATNGTTPVSVFPGELAVSSSNRFIDISAQAAPVLLNALAPGASHPRIEPVATLNDTGLQAAKTAVDDWQHYCNQGVAPPPECGPLSNGDTTVSVTGAGDFSRAQFSFDPNTMKVAVSGSITYAAHSARTATVTYNAAGSVDLTKDPPVYTSPSGHR
jgi:hypothetical protein